MRQTCNSIVVYVKCARDKTTTAFCMHCTCPDSQTSQVGAAIIIKPKTTQFCIILFQYTENMMSFIIFLHSSKIIRKLCGLCVYSYHSNRLCFSTYSIDGYMQLLIRIKSKWSFEFIKKKRNEIHAHRFGFAYFDYRMEQLNCANFLSK